MAITIDDIYDKEFALKGGGYDRDDVDQFLDEICDEMTNMQQKMADLDKELQTARQELTLAREELQTTRQELTLAREASQPAPVEETPITKTSATLESILLSAQKLADDEVAKARQKAQEIVSEAEDKASHLVDDAQEEKETLLKSMATMRGAAADYRKRFLELLKTYQDLLNEDASLFEEE